MGSLWRRCAKVRELSELRFGVVRVVGQGFGGGPSRARRREGLGFFRSRFSLLDVPLGRPQRNVLFFLFIQASTTKAINSHLHAGSFVKI